MMADETASYGVIVRVHDRMDDLGVLLGLIRHRWQRAPRQLVVVSNGMSAGIEVPRDARELADCVIEQDHNTGDCLGSLDLIESGLGVLDPSLDWVVLLEADTWVLDDAVVHRTIEHLAATRQRWASARWVEKRPSLALDFAIFARSLVRDARHLFRRSADDVDAEGLVARRLTQLGETPLLLQEAMPVHVPGFVRRLGFDRYQGRYRSFPGVPMLTHHVEDLPGGMNEKLRLANSVAGKALFPEVEAGTPQSRIIRRSLAALRRWIPRGQWVRLQKRLPGQPPASVARPLSEPKIR